MKQVLKLDRVVKDENLDDLNKKMKSITRETVAPKTELVILSGKRTIKYDIFHN